MSQTLTALAAALPLATGWAVHSLRLRYQIQAARRDPLSGLLTRDPFEKRARKTLACGSRAVVVIDLDGFKLVNDTYGHAAGDVVIAAVGERLKRWSLDNGGIAARLGGDEFVAVASVHSRADLRWAMDELAIALGKPVNFEGRDLYVGFSAGVVWSQPHGTAFDLPRLMRRADEVMFGVKQTGGGWQAACDPTLAYRTVNGRRDGRRGTANATGEPG
ncbi:GGDEF domain-containing protein [Streptomyces gamaensis]|uniref:GGDEF domain-containing protein n=1 Tax=Streptomyces gamaensis TaxID=1763542 RepID=A0ABW0YWU2_9ACTN